VHVIERPAGELRIVGPDEPGRPLVIDGGHTSTLRRST
jgi:hypothetical protein